MASKITKLKIMLDDGAYMPERAHSTDAGLDLRTPRAFTVYPNGSAVIDTGVHVELPPNTVGMLKSKSGLNVKCGITTEGGDRRGLRGLHCCQTVQPRQKAH